MISPGTAYGRGHFPRTVFGLLAVLWAAALAAQFPPAALAAAGELSAQEIMDRLEDLHRGESSHGFMTMAIDTAQWKRTLFLEYWIKGKDKSLFRIVTPEQEKGTAILRSGKDVWNYLPRVKRTIKVPLSMMSASCMGSHFNNDDLVKVTRVTADYDCSISFSGVRDGREVVEITCVPKPRASVVWGKITVVVRRADYLPVSMQCYDEEGKLVRTTTFSEVKKMGGRSLPSRLTVTVAFKPGEKTVVTYHDIAFNVNLSDKLFTQESLQQ